MIQNLLTALGVAALSIQTPNNNTHEDPKRAYYDSSAVAEYGTEAGKAYNYTSNDLYSVDLSGTAQINPNSKLDQGGSHAYSLSNSYLALPVFTTGLDMWQTTRYWAGTNTQSETYDIYVNGVLTIAKTSTAYNETYYIQVSQTDLGITNTTAYIWIFDHYEAPPMSQTIIETAGDATTAAAAVVGAGFTGVISLFYNDGITGLGILSLIMAGVALVWFALSLVMKLWRRR